MIQLSTFRDEEHLVQRSLDDIQLNRRECSSALDVTQTVQR